MSAAARSAKPELNSPRCTVAAVQFAPAEDPATNLIQLRRWVHLAAEQGAELVLAPEYSMIAMRRLDHRVVAAAEPLTGPFVTGLAELARDARLTLVAGVAEATTENRIYNTVVVLTPTGTLRTYYRKVHLYDAFGQRESEIVRAGPLDDPPIFTVSDITFGVQTCFDLRFPEGCRRVAAAGAQVLLVPAQWIPGPGKVAQWLTLLRARAIENTGYVVAADHSAPRGAGASSIIDPTGEVLAELDNAPGIITAEVSSSRLAQVRSVNPSLDLRRFTIVPR